MKSIHNIKNDIEFEVKFISEPLNGKDEIRISFKIPKEDIFNKTEVEIYEHLQVKYIEPYINTHIILKYKNTDEECYKNSLNFMDIYIKNDSMNGAREAVNFIFQKNKYYKDGDRF